MENNKINVSGSNGNNDIFITTSQNSENITVDTNRNSISINATNNNALHYSNKAKEWAEKSEESAKESKESADRTGAALNELLSNEDLKKVSANEENINKVANDIENVNFVGENIEDITELVTSLENLGDTTNINIVASNIDNINSLAEDIQTVEENKNIVLSQVDVAIEQAEISTNQANISIAQATISTAQATKSENNANLSYQYSQNAKDKADICIENASICEEQALISRNQAEIANHNARNSKLYYDNIQQISKEIEDASNQIANVCDEVIENANIVTEKTNIAIEKSNNAKIWAEGTDSEVQALGGVHSSKGWAEIGGSGSGSNIDTTNLVTKDGTETITGAKSFTGAVNLIGSGDTNAVGVGTNTRFNVHNTNKTVLGFGNNLFYINHGDYRLRLRGKDTRPHYNSDTNYLALLSDVPDTSNFATKDEVNAKQDKGNYLTPQSLISYPTFGDLKNYVTTEQAEIALQTKQDKGDYALKSDIPTDYLTEQQLEEKNYVDTDRFLFGLETKQDVLIAGENITIKGNTISATGGSTGGSGGGMPIGAIYFLNCTANYIPDGSLACDGAEYSKAQFNDLWNNYLSANLLNTCTYAEYESDLATYGQCGKFAIDTTRETFRVPLIKNGSIIQQAQTNDELGKSYNAGLPNITGTVYVDANGSENGANGSGALSQEQIGKEGAIGDTGASTFITLDASLSNSIYGNSDTVQPNAVALRFFVVVSNGSINQSQMDWSAWASGLAGKVDVSNTQWAVNACIPDYSMGITPSHPTSEAPFTAPADGVFLECFYYSKDTTSKLFINDIETTFCMVSGSTNRNNRGNVIVPLKKGDVIYWDTGVTESYGIGFYPYKGGKQ